MKKLAPGQLKRIIALHEDWLESGGTKGKMGDLRGADLREAKLQKANLQDADLRGADLRGVNLQDAFLKSANFQDADLREAHLQRANLQEANLENANLLKADIHDANLQDTNLREANLQNADLTGVKNLLPKQLAGSKLAGAAMSESTKIEGLERAAEASKNAKRLFQFMLWGCIYAWLTIAATNDVNLLINSATSPLPIIGTNIQIVWFYFAAPILLLACYGYFHIYLQSLWEELAYKPAIFPDGKRLDEKAYPWILNGFVYSFFRRLKDERPHLAGLKSLISLLLAWGVVPVTLGLFWWRYLTRHDWGVTILHIILLLISLWAGSRFYLLSATTFRGKKNFSWRESLTYMENRIAGIAILVLVVVFVPLYSLGAINRSYPESLSYLFSGTIANFKGAEARGAILKGRNLKQVKASRSFLLKADLRGANLISADFWEADLREANLQKANLQGAYFCGANLQGVDFEWANLKKANLKGADLQEANLQKADLRGAGLGDANLQGANLWKANLREANLWLANLHKASLIWADLGNAKLEGANLQGANLQGANLQGAHLEGADLTDVTDLTHKQIESAHTDERTKLPAYLKQPARTNQANLD